MFGLMQCQFEGVGRHGVRWIGGQMTDCLASFPTTDSLMGYEIVACVACDVDIGYAHFDWSIDFRPSCNTCSQDECMTTDARC